MALTKNTIAASYPLPAYSYKVTVGRDTLSFSEVSGLQVGYEKIVYKHGMSFLAGPNIIRAQQNDITLTLKRGVVAKRSVLFNWLEDKSKKDIMIDLCDEKGEAVVRWKVHMAMPLKMDAPSFNAANNELAFESLELIAQNLTVEYF
ncbi:MAG: phage tail protein [Williamsia sp.]|nr:phage tail protein [Williamsia sp.]